MGAATSLSSRALRGASFLIGCLLGGVLVGLALVFIAALIAWVPFSFRLVAGWALVALALFGHYRYGHEVLPQLARQIPRTVFDQGVLKGLFRFGVEYGSGVRTFVTSSAAALLALLILMFPLGYLGILAISLAFGAGRAVPVLLYAVPARHDLMQGHVRRLGQHSERVAPLVVVGVGILVSLESA